MKKKSVTALVLAASLLAAGLSGCGGAKKPTTPSTENKSSEVSSQTTTENPSEEKPATEANEPQAPSQEGRGLENLSIAVGEEYASEWDEKTERIYASMSYGLVQLVDEYADSFPALQAALQKQNEEKAQAIKKEYEDLIKEAKERDGDDIQGNSEIKEEVYVRRADEAATSLLYSGYSYNGGAHPAYSYTGVNFDTQTGKKLAITDVITDTAKFAELAEAALKEEYPELSAYDNMDLKQYLTDAENLANLSWTLDYQSLTIYFNPYEIASGAEGYQCIALSYAANPGLVKEEYTRTPEKYGIELTPELPFYYDLDEDGKMEIVNTYGEQEEDYISKLTVYANGDSLTTDCYSYSIAPMLIHSGEKENYLFVETTEDNDYRNLIIYDLFEANIMYLGEIYSGRHTFAPADETAYYCLTLCLTDPACFLLDTHTDVLSTGSGLRSYTIGEDGLPTPMESIYQLSYPYVFTALKDIKAEQIDPITYEPAGMITIPKGSTATYYATDGEVTGYLMLEDGTQCRLLLDKEDEWPKTIDGEDLEALFDGIVFAG